MFHPQACMLLSRTISKYPAFVGTVRFRGFWDTCPTRFPPPPDARELAAKEGYDRLRSLARPQTDVVLVYLDLGIPSVIRERQDEVVALACRGREARGEGAAVGHSRAGRAAREMGAVRYVECLAQTHQGVESVFDEAVLAAVQPEGVVWRWAGISWVRQILLEKKKLIAVVASIGTVFLDLFRDGREGNALDCSNSYNGVVSPARGLVVAMNLYDNTLSCRHPHDPRFIERHKPHGSTPTGPMSTQVLLQAYKVTEFETLT
ncbi:hypothetical protein C8R47DRAFT_1218396 [Mycena vitilis]|nr:hypothetical protein C8R47DRAFT_1218396 [Mycena vitilis]